MCHMVHTLVDWLCHSLWHRVNPSTLTSASSVSRLNWCDSLSSKWNLWLVRWFGVLWDLRISVRDAVVVRSDIEYRWKEWKFLRWNISLRWFLWIHNAALYWSWHLRKNRVCAIQSRYLLQANGARNIWSTVACCLKKSLKQLIMSWISWSLSLCCFPRRQSAGLCVVQAIWCSHQLKVNFPTFFPSLLSPTLGGSFFHASSFFLRQEPVGETNPSNWWCHGFCGNTRFMETGIMTPTKHKSCQKFISTSFGSFWNLISLNTETKNFEGGVLSVTRNLSKFEYFRSTLFLGNLYFT